MPARRAWMTCKVTGSTCIKTGVRRKARGLSKARKLGSYSDSRLGPRSSYLLLLNNYIAIFIYRGLLLGVDHGGGVQLLDDRRATDLVAGFKQIAAKNLRRQGAVLLPEEYFALASLRGFHFASRDFPRRQFRLGNEPQRDQA